MPGFTPTKWGPTTVLLVLTYRGYYFRIAKAVAYNQARSCLYRRKDTMKFESVADCRAAESQDVPEPQTSPHLRWAWMFAFIGGCYSLWALWLYAQHKPRAVESSIIIGIGALVAFSLAVYQIGSLLCQKLQAKEQRDRLIDQADATHLYAEHPYVM